ncbi:hypothetical protein Pcinc_028171 [Petrolisthes cinctipes]|uniref:Uncharacterized protein n=1 Tax=Petrolisthes cinctipes TaxID=88211 RepID=A0AAE1F3P4_PETCI|nr:hypothetical protein Pcinc_028171 [Petrolisthes cinctipes]
MDDSNSIEASGAFGIPKWIMKKGMRYEVDDFIVSPPTNDDEGFMRLRYGRYPSQRHHHLSPVDGAQSDLAMTVEVVDGAGVRRNSNSQDTFGHGATITFGPGVLSAEATPFSSPLLTPEPVSESSQTSQLRLVEKCKDVKTASAQDNVFPEFQSFVTIDEEPTQPSRSFAVSGCETLEKLSPRPSLESFLENGENIRKINPEDLLSTRQLNTAEVRADDRPKTPTHQHPKVFGIPVETIASSVRKISSTTRPCLDSLLHEGEVKEKLSGVGESLSSEDSPEITPKHTPIPSPVLPRKIPGIAMEKMSRKVSAHSYFCTKPFNPQDLQQQEIGNENNSSVQSYFSNRTYLQEKQQGFPSSEQESARGVISLSSTASAQNQKLEEGTNLAQALDLSGKVIGKKRQRPKPSALREMNFWAPTSM